MKSSYLLESEVLVISKYCEIIDSLFDSFNSISVTKVLIFSFIQKKKYSRRFNLYRSNNKNDLKNK
ncbi:MAG: hypothetical protein PQJ44_07575, partial [Sphaerochaetaceae bacterium]|nr:hypothetical protein [Sphaerochaetaceae bacterium]